MADPREYADVIAVENCLECPCSSRHPYDEELECDLSPGDSGVDTAGGAGIPVDCPLRAKPLLVTLEKKDD